jgi:hypothetical protein
MIKLYIALLFINTNMCFEEATDQQNNIEREEYITKC